MTDKEKEAIRVLNEDLKLAKEEDSIDIDVLTGNLEITLNLIEKQQAEIEKLKNNNKDLLRKLRNRVKEVKKLEKYSLYKKEFATLNKRIEKKDKIIDLMAEYIARIDIGEDICMNNLANTELCNEECSNCVECIKQYFERKIEQ